MTNQSPAERILEELFLLGMSAQRTEDVFNALHPRRSNKDLSYAKTQLRDALLDQVIGVDETQEWDEEYAFCERCQFERTDDSKDCLCVVRNQLRAEQRKALWEFFGGSDG